MQNNAFLLCNPEGNNILKVDTSGKVSELIHFAPLFPVKIGNTLSDNLLVSLVDEPSGSWTEKSQGKVQMISVSGKLVCIYEYNDDGTTPVLTRPDRVTQNYNSDVCVANLYEVAKGDWLGNVCVFYEDVGLKFVYSGYGGEFYPSGICCDSLCNIICSNLVDDTIHVISSEGVFVQFLFTRDTCIPYPNSLALHRGVLWVGSHGGEVRMYRYKY